MNNRRTFYRSRTVWLFTAALASMFILAGCGMAGNPQGSAPPPKPQAVHHHMTNIHVDLNWLPNVEFSGLWVAINKGWFKKAGLNIPGITSGLGPGVRPYDYNDTPELENDLCTKQANTLCVGVDDSSAIPIARQAGQLVTALWAGSQKTPFGFMTCYVPPKGTYNKCVSKNKIAAKHKNITSPAQWKGLRIGYQQDELYVPALMLGSVGLSLSDVKPVQVGFSTTDLTTGNISDAHLIFVNNEPLQLKLQGVRTNVIPASKYGMSAFYADVMFAPSSYLKNKADEKALKTFVGLVDKGWKWAMHNPNAAATLIVKHFFTSANGGGSSQLAQQKLEIAQFAHTLARDSQGKIDGRMTLPRWTQIIKALKTYPGNPGGKPIITTNIKPASCFTDAFAPPAAK